MNNPNNDEIRKESPLETVLSQLRGVKALSNGSYQARCPVPGHDDRNPSLSVGEGTDGKVLLKCHGGCPTGDVVSALGLDLGDLFPDNHDASWKPWEGEKVEAYSYTDADDRPLFQVVRYEMRDPSHPACGDKTFVQQTYMPDNPKAGRKGCPKGYVWGRKDVPTVPYRLPSVLAAIDRKEAVYLVEGEKDVHTLEEVGLTATCIAGGANAANWTPELTEMLAGAKVVCIPDNDEAGRSFMKEVAGHLACEAKDVRILELPGLSHKGDVTDWLDGTGTLKQLTDLAEDTEPVGPMPRTPDELVDLCERGSDGDGRALVFKHIDLLAQASPEKLPRLKEQIKAATGVNLNDLQKAISDAQERLEAERQEQERLRRRDKLAAEDKQNVVVTGRPSDEIVDDICEVVETANDPPSLFRRESEIVRVVTGQRDKVHIETVSEAFFDDWVSRQASCTDGEFKPRDPSKRIIARVQERVELPVLQGVSRIPILRLNGSVMSEPGYDPKTELLYCPPSGTKPVPVAEDPSDSQVEKAVELLQEAWIDHPFDGEASKANMFALALTPVVRPLLDGANIPLCIIDATRAGSGKTMLAEIAATIGTGQTPGVMSSPSSDEEWRKQITAQLRRGEGFVVVDDVMGTIGSPSLRRVLTSSEWSDRLLGESQQIQLPASAVWCATGNNLRPHGDMVRRCYLVRLDTRMARPWTREGFTHDQPAWTRKHRVRLAAALFTLVRAWISAGRPKAEVPTLGGFERWSTTIGGILEHAGIEGFLDNLDELQEAPYSEDNEWSILLEALHEWQEEVLQSQNGFLASELEEFLRAKHEGFSQTREGDLGKRILERLPQKIQNQIHHGEPAARSLGKTLSYKQDRRFPGGWYLTVEAEDRDGTRWKVCCSESGEKSSAENAASQPNPQSSGDETPRDAPF
jgi:hypothetical protein